METLNQIFQAASQEMYAQSNAAGAEPKLRMQNLLQKMLPMLILKRTDFFNVFNKG